MAYTSCVCVKVISKRLWCFFTLFGRLVCLRPDAGLVWLGPRTYPRALFTPNRSVGHAIPDNFGANQWGRTGVSGNDNAIQFFHYRLLLCPVQLCAVSWVNIVVKSNKFSFPMILVWDRKWVNIARYSVKTIWLVDESDVVFILSLGDKRSGVRGGPDPILGGKTSVSSVRSRRPMEWKSTFTEYIPVPTVAFVRWAVTITISSSIRVVAIATPSTPPRINRELMLNYRTIQIIVVVMAHMLYFSDKCVYCLPVPPQLVNALIVHNRYKKYTTLVWKLSLHSFPLSSHPGHIPS